MYTAGYYSADYIQRLFKKYHVQVTGAITGTGRKVSGSAEAKRKLEGLITAKYPETVHVDGEAVLRVFSKTREAEEYDLGGAGEGWSQRVMDVMETFPRHG